MAKTVKENVWTATGRRKSSSARVTLKNGKGNVISICERKHKFYLLIFSQIIILIILFPEESKS